jgi:hypothetical protein
MGIREIERALVEELREVVGDASLRLRDVAEWSTGDLAQVGPGEAFVRLPKLGVNVAYVPRKARVR